MTLLLKPFTGNFNCDNSMRQLHIPNHNNIYFKKTEIIKKQNTL